MSQTLRKDTRIDIPKRKAGEVAKARPCLGDRATQLKKIRESGLKRYSDAYRELAKV